MWNAISNMIIKAADNMNRGVENASTKSGDGNNGQDYQMETADTGSSGAGGGYSAVSQDTSGVDSVKDSTKGLADTAVNQLSKNVGSNEENSEEQNNTSVNTPSVGGITSDERLKRIFGDNQDAVQAFARLDSIKFTYNDKAKEVHPDGENGVDNDQHYGIKAQDLEKNPYTTAVVSEDANGYKQIDPAELTSVNTAVIAEICKRLLIIEKVLGIKVV